MCTPAASRVKSRLPAPNIFTLQTLPGHSSDLVASDLIVISPFAGIGSEGYEAVRLGRKYLGIELKESYWRTAVKNLQTAETLKHQGELFESSAAR